jgi:hypothetical protein
MPSVSKKQHNLMAAVANNPAVAKKANIPQSVGKEFLNADKGKKFNGGGMATKMKFPSTTPMGKVKTAAPSRDGVAVQGKTKGKQIVMPGNKMTGKGMKSGGKC